MKKIALIFISSLLTILLIGNNDEKLDSLKLLLSDAKDTTQVNILNEIGKFYVDKDKQSAIEYGLKAYELAREIGFERGLGVSCNNLGVYYLETKQYNEALNYLFESIKYDEKSSNDLGKAKSIKNIGVIYHRKQEVDSAVKYYSKAGEIFYNLDDKELYAKSIAGIGTVYAQSGRFAEALENYFIVVDVFKEIDDKNQIAQSSGITGNLYLAIGDYPKALEYHLEAVKVYGEIGNRAGVASYIGSIGNVYMGLDDPDKALEYYQKAQIIFDSLGLKYAIASSYGNIANVLQHQNKYTEALENYNKALDIYTELDNKGGIAAALTNIGETYREIEQYDKALEYLFESLRIKKEINDILNQTMSLNGISQVYVRIGNYPQALKYINECLEIAVKVGALDNTKEAYKLLTEIYENQNDYKQAYKYQTLYIETKDSLFNDENNKKIADLQTKFEVEKKEKEIELQKTELAKKDAILKQRNTQRNALVAGLVLLLVIVLIIYNAYRHRKKTNLILRQQKDEIETQADELEIKNTELEKLSIVASETDNAIVIASADGNIEWVNQAFTKLYGYTLEEFKEQKGNNLIETSSNPQIKKIIEKAISQKTTVNYITNSSIKSGTRLWVQTTLTPILDESGNITKIVAIDSDITEIKKAEKRINEQKEQIEEQNRNITDSIVYAQRIQRALLPPGDYMKQLLPKRFILYKPRDIVSGDFYWVSKKNDIVITAAADCTGHGVPGAMMSMLGVSMLNEVVNTSTKLDAGEILNQLRTKMIDSLHQGGTGSHLFDGINISLCLIDTKKNVVQYSGAFSPLYLIREGKLEETKGDKMPIGPYARMESFTTHIIRIQEGDMLYLFSDGYADQFGGEHDKRFTQRRFRKLLDDIHELPMTDQQEELERTLNDWQNKTDQIDDILVMGVRI